MRTKEETQAIKFSKEILELYTKLNPNKFHFYLGKQVNHSPYPEFDLAILDIYCRVVSIPVGCITFRPSDGIVIQISSLDVLIETTIEIYNSERSIG